MKTLMLQSNDVLRNDDPENLGGGGSAQVNDLYSGDDTYPNEDADDTPSPDDEGGTGGDDPDGDNEGAGSGKAKKDIDPDAINTLASSLTKSIQQQIQSATQQTQQTKEKQLSPEEIERVFRPARVTKEMLQGLGFEDATDQQVKTMQSIVNAAVTNAVHTSNYLIQQQVEQIRSQLEPIRDQVSTQQSQQQFEQFFAENPDLNNYRKIVAAVASQVSEVDEQGNPKTLVQIKKEVATLARQVLKESGINLQSQTQQRKPATHGAVPPMNNLGGSGRSPGAGSGGSKQNNPDADIWS